MNCIASKNSQTRRNWVMTEYVLGNMEYDEAMRNVLISKGAHSEGRKERERSGSPFGIPDSFRFFKFFLHLRLFIFAFIDGLLPYLSYFLNDHSFQNFHQCEKNIPLWSRYKNGNLFKFATEIYKFEFVKQFWNKICE